jgi:hypothetical protein
VEGAGEEEAAGGLEPLCGLATPLGLPEALCGLDGKGGVGTPGWLVDWLVGSGVGVESMSLINDYNSNFWCRCNLYAIFLAAPADGGYRVTSIGALK